METEFKLKIKTEGMSKGEDMIPDDENVSAESCMEEIEQSIHSAIPKVITDPRIMDVINSIIEEGGWIDDVEGWEYPKDYCENFELEVITK